MKNLDIRSKKRIALDKIRVGLQKCKLGEYVNNDLIRDYLTARYVIIENN